ncbi:MarR family transcriptional regulator [Streptomyces sp. SID10853]|uniref:MarR family winged helix-turn-helix transcriptional regulator n=1 Tax=Streptomyces sp. SID10853 TaxID=2706028 RepID=UPI0013C28F25|nr:MarR family transcriptional regulator [Streptomyces sp. SID10853]NDZ80868.1 MarR family transcriptional regulator [Streptomyces sp. SID10853]
MLPSPAEVRAQWSSAHPGLDTASMEVVELLKRAIALVSTAVESVYEGAPLTVPEVDLLIPLRYATAPVIARRIAEHHGLSRAAVSKTLAKLDRRGFITRTPSAADKRVALITVTPEGKKAVDALFPHQLKVESVLLSALGDDQPKVLEALSLLVRSMESRLATASRESARG